MSWNIDNAHSVAEFSVRHMMISTVKGRFKEINGTINLDENDFTKSTIEASVSVSEIDTRDEKRDGHLRSADFFDAEKYPTLNFKSTKIEKTGENEYKLTGDLTIRDVTKPITFNVEYQGQAKSPWGTTSAGFSADASINRKDFGLNWNVALETGGWLVGDQIKIHLEVEAVKQVPAPANV